MNDFKNEVLKLELSYFWISSSETGPRRMIAWEQSGWILLGITHAYAHERMIYH